MEQVGAFAASLVSAVRGGKLAVKFYAEDWIRLDCTRGIEYIVVSDECKATPKAGIRRFYQRYQHSDITYQN